MNQIIPLLAEEEGLAPTPVYQRLAARLRNAIVSRRLPAGSPLPDERELAASLKLSRGTVRKALESLIDQKLIVRQHGRGSFVAQRERLPAVPLAVVFDVESPADVHAGSNIDVTSYLGRVVQSMLQTAGRVGAELLLRGSARAGVAGAVSPAAHLFIMPASPKPLLELSNAGQRVISVDVRTREPGIDSVVYPNADGIADATRRLIALGHERIAFIDVYIERGNRRIENPNSTDRKEGYLAAVREARLKDLVVSLPLGIEEIAQAMKEYLRQQRPTAVVAFDDTAALGAAEAAKSMGMNVPADLSIATVLQEETFRGHGIDFSGMLVSQNLLSRTAIEHAMKCVDEPEIKGQVVTLPSLWHEGRTVAESKKVTAS